MTGRVSIIVPIYNCEKWLPVCLDSLTGQTYTELEIILVDDGSTDGSLRICEEYARKDRRICLVRKENGGVSQARNEGLRHVTGEWVTFVDADDWLDLDTIERICAEIGESWDLYIWDMIQSNEGNDGMPQYIHHITMEEVYCAIISGRKGSGYHLGSMVRASWGKLYRAEILKKNHILFDEDLYIGEDAVFILMYLRQLDGAGRIKAVNVCGYHYRILDTSATHRYKADLLEQSLRQKEGIRKLLAEGNLLHGRKIQTALAVLCWQIFDSLIINELRKQESGRYSDALWWLEQNRKQMLWGKVEPWKMPRFVLLLWLYARFLTGEQVCRMRAFYLRKRYRRRLEENGK